MVIKWEDWIVHTGDVHR